MNALMLSPISLFRPGDCAKPRSSPYPISMLLSVTPRSVAPLASPLPHGESRVPNFEAVDADELPPPPLLEFVALGSAPRPPPLLQEETATTAASAIPSTPSERLFVTTPPVENTKRPHSSASTSEQDR